MTFTLLPAVDVRDGKAVRLFQGRSGTETGYGDPLAAALAWQEAGAEWVHLVDLDAAFGTGDNRALLAEIVSELDISVELTGGIRDDASLSSALATGCARVNLGTAAVTNPSWCTEVIASHGAQVAVGLDVRADGAGGWRVATKGWTEDGGDLWSVLSRLESDGCARYVVTDVSKDGTLKGPNVDLLRAVAAATTAPVIASGGIAEVSDLVALAEAAAAGANIEGSIVGKALYAGRFTLPEALAAVRAVAPAQPAAS